MQFFLGPLLDITHSLCNDIHNMFDLLTADSERRGKAHDVLVGRFGEHPEACHLEANLVERGHTRQSSKLVITQGRGLERPTVVFISRARPIPYECHRVLFSPLTSIAP